MILDDLIEVFLWYVAHKLSKMILDARQRRRTLT
jgi:hypothetical protein